MSSSRPGEIVGLDPATGDLLTVRIDDGRIAGVDARSTDDESSVPWLSAGLVDLQVNGFGGFDANAAEGGPEIVVAMVRALFDVGVTTVVPTVVTQSEEHITACLRRIAAARDSDPLVRHAVPFVHVEGPNLSAEDGPRGVHPVEHIRAPSVEEFDRWQQACAGLIGMVTLSPHWPDSESYINCLASQGVRVSLGHTHADRAQISAAADAGASLCTHLGNGAHAVIPRHPNYVWAQLAEDRLSAGFIGDGHHLPAETLIAMLRAKGLSRSFLVSDATTLAGAAPGIYRTPVGGEVELSEDGRLSQRGTPYLAGAARSLSDGVAQVAGLGPFSLAAALSLATATPGRVVAGGRDGGGGRDARGGLAGRDGSGGPGGRDGRVGRGTLAVGATADLVRFRWRPGQRGLDIDDVLVAGSRVVGAGPAVSA